MRCIFFTLFNSFPSFQYKTFFPYKNSFFFYQGFLHRHWRFTGQQEKGGDHLLFHSATSTRSRTLRHLLATLHVRWLSRIFNRNACVYQTATQWDLPPYRITIWLIDDAMFVCLLDELILGFCYSDFDMGNRWIWTRIDYHPCVTSEPTDQVYILCKTQIFLQKKFFFSA